MSVTAIRQRSRITVLHGKIRVVTPEGDAFTLEPGRAIELFFGTEFREAVRRALNELEPKVERE